MDPWRKQGRIRIENFQPRGEPMADAAVCLEQGLLAQFLGHAVHFNPVLKEPQE